MEALWTFQRSLKSVVMGGVNNTFHIETNQEWGIGANYVLKRAWLPAPPLKNMCPNINCVEAIPWREEKAATIHIPLQQCMHRPGFPFHWLFKFIYCCWGISRSYSDTASFWKWNCGRATISLNRIATSPVNTVLVSFISKHCRSYRRPPWDSVISKRVHTMYLPDENKHEAVRLFSPLYTII